VSTQIDRREWIARCLHSASVATLLPAALAADDWAPQSLSRQQNATLVALGEAIVPGSAAANCNRVIDGILVIESQKNQADLKAALDAFRSFPSSRPEERTRILTAASTTHDSLSPHFELIKEWIADTYWSSEQGLKELGWNGRVAWANYPGCQKHAS
jgi:hypothetical protein